MGCFFFFKVWKHEGLRKMFIGSLLRKSKMFHVPPMREPGWQKGGAWALPLPATEKRMLARPRIAARRVVGAG